MAQHFNILRPKLVQTMLINRGFIFAVNKFVIIIYRGKFSILDSAYSFMMYAYGTSPLRQGPP